MGRCNNESANVKLLKTSALAVSEIVTLNFEDLPIMQVALHGFPDVVREAHAEERVRNLFVPVDLTQLEETAGDGCGILQRSSE